METTIYIKDYLPAFVSSRKSIQLIKDKVSLRKGGSYVFDFIEISFISRSFADELIKYLKEHSIKFQFRNHNQNIEAILSVVQKTQKPIERHFDNIAITFYRNRQDLKGLLTTL